MGRVAGVHAHVASEFHRQGEGLAAVLASVGPRSAVRRQKVVSHGAAVSEGGRAQSASIGFLACVDASVDHKTGLRGKCHVTEVALEWSLATVPVANVNLQNLLGETFVGAVTALPRFDPPVPLQVGLQMMLIRICGRTQVTAVRLVTDTFMAAHVNGQAALFGACDIAVRTAVTHLRRLLGSHIVAISRARARRLWQMLWHPGG